MLDPFRRLGVFKSPHSDKLPEGLVVVGSHGTPDVAVQVVDPAGKASMPEKSRERSVFRGFQLIQTADDRPQIRELLDGFMRRHPSFRVSRRIGLKEPLDEPSNPIIRLSQDPNESHHYRFFVGSERARRDGTGPFDPDREVNRGTRARKEVALRGMSFLLCRQLVAAHLREATF
jgi:hypothetical protein